MDLPDTTRAWSNQIPQIRRAPGISLTEAEITLLRQAFSASPELFVEREFRSGYSGAVVLLVSLGQGQAQMVVKLGSPDDLQREYTAYKHLVEPASPQNTARLKGEPLLAEDGQLALLVYTFAGGDPRQPTHSIQAYYDRHGGQATAAILDRVFRIYGRQWWAINQPHKFVLAEQYDRLLPVHLRLKPIVISERTSEVLKIGEAGLVIQAGQTSAASLRDLQSGQAVRLCDFRVSQVRPDQGEITLTADPPPGEASAPLRLRLETDQAATYQPGDRLENLTAVVIATRQTLLAEAACLALPSFDPTATSLNLNGRTYPNPLHDLPALLDRVIEARFSTIHGDLNLQNILVDAATGFAWLIDFAETRRGPTLFDLQLLESQVITKLLPLALVQARLGLTAVADLLEALHSDPPRPLVPHPALQEPYTLLVAIRRLARQYLMDDRDWDEYYLGLAIVLVGSLKFVELESAAHRIAFVGAAVIWSLVGRSLAPLVSLLDPKILAKQRQKRHVMRWILYGTLASALTGVLGSLSNSLLFPHPPALARDTYVGLISILSAVWGLFLSSGLACGELFTGWLKIAVRILASTIAVALGILLAGPILNKAGPDFYSFLFMALMYTLSLGVGASLGEMAWSKRPIAGYLLCGSLGVILTALWFNVPLSVLINLSVVIGTGMAGIQRRSDLGLGKNG